MTITEIKERIKVASRKLGLDANALMREYGATSALADMLDRELITLKNKAS